MLGGVIEGTGKAITLASIQWCPTTARQRSVNAIKEVEQARNWTEENGIQEKTPDGNEFTPDEPEDSLLDQAEAAEQPLPLACLEAMKPGGAV